VRDPITPFSLRTALGAAVLFGLAPAAALAEQVSILVPVDPSMEAAALAVENCAFERPALSGEGLVFDCPVQQVYRVTIGMIGASETETRFGYVEPTDRRAPAKFDPRPVYKMDLSSTDEEAARAAFAAAEDGNRPAAFRDPAASSAITAAEADPAPETPEEPAAPAVETDGPRVLDLTWRAEYGTLSLASGQPVETSDQAGGSMFGKLGVTEPAGTIEVRSNRNIACSTTVDYTESSGQLTVDLPCREVAVTLPFPVDMDADACRNVTPQALSCLVGTDKSELSLDAKGWQPMTVTMPEDGSATIVADAAGLRPEMNLERVQTALRGSAEQSCSPRQLDLQFAGYCTADTCVPLDGEPVLLSGILNLPDLAQIGWAQPMMPTAVMMQLVDRQNPNLPATERILNIGDGLTEAALAYIDDNASQASHPLKVELDIQQYKFGRQMRLYSDAACSDPLGTFVDLSNPGNRAPDVPECSFFKLYDGDRVRSQCVAIPYNEVQRASTAKLPTEPCADQRIVVVVAENSSLNGRAGQEIVRGLSGVVESLGAAENCASVDVVHTAGERREILLHAEDIFFAQDAIQPTAMLSMDFVNRSSEILRDFEWVYRTWGDRLAGIVLVSDGSQVRPTDMIDSPAAMAWKIKNVMTYAINFAPDANCEVFENTLLFGNCVAGELDSFEDQLTAGIAEGLKAVRKSQ
jgi:hypothetical protein